MLHTGSSFAEARANRTRKYDEKIRPVVEELQTFGFGNAALANALNTKGYVTVTGGEYTTNSVVSLLKRLSK